MYEAQDLGSGREYALKVRGRHVLCAFLGALEAVSLWQRREGVFPVTGGLLPATCVHPVSSGGEELTATPGLAAASGLGAWGQVWPVVLRVPSEAPTSRWPQPLCDRCVHSVLGRVRWDSGRAGRWVLSGDSGAQPGLRRPSRVCSWAAPAPGPHLPPWARARPLSAAESPFLSLSWFTPPLGRTGSWAALLVCLGMGEGPCSGSGPLGAPTWAGPSAPVQLCRCGFKAAGTDLVCAPPTQRLLSSEEDRSRAIIQEVCFMVSFSRCLPKPAPPLPRRAGPGLPPADCFWEGVCPCSRSQGSSEWFWGLVPEVSQPRAGQPLSVLLRPMGPPPPCALGRRAPCANGGRRAFLTCSLSAGAAPEVESCLFCQNLLFLS